MKLVLKIVGVIAILIAIGVVGLVMFGGQVIEKQKMHLAKAIQSEAKINLNMAFMNQKSFWAETGMYTSSFLAGNLPLVEGSVANYKLGFAKAEPLDATVMAQAKQMDPNFSVEQFSTDQLGIVPRNQLTQAIPFDKLAAEHGCFAEKDKFKICAIGFAGEQGNLDIWTIDQDKNLVNVVDGSVAKE